MLSTLMVGVNSKFSEIFVFRIILSQQENCVYKYLVLMMHNFAESGVKNKKLIGLHHNNK